MTHTALAHTEHRLELRGIRKTYPAVVANDGIDLRVDPGEIHAVVGENGAGKSTLMKIIYGMVRPDSGEVLWDGREVSIASPADAQKLGIGMVFQHFALFDTLTVAENIALALPGRPSIETLSKRIAEVATRYGLPVEPGMVLAGALRVAFNASEILVSLMPNYVAALWLSWLIFGLWRDPGGFSFPQSEPLAPAALFPILIENTRANISVLFALAAILAGWLFMSRSFAGFSSRSQGFPRERRVMLALGSGGRSGLACWPAVPRPALPA